MLGRRAPWYAGGQRRAYGPIDSYLEAEAWLSGLSVEDWGCGYARFKDFHKGGYRGVDGTPGWADHVAACSSVRGGREEASSDSDRVLWRDNLVRREDLNLTENNIRCTSVERGLFNGGTGREETDLGRPGASCDR